MNKTLPVTLAALLLPSAFPVWSQQAPVWQTLGRPGAETDPFGGSYQAEYTRSFDSNLNVGDTNLGEMAADLARVTYTAVFRPNKEYQWGLGVQWDYATFDLPASTPAPDEMHGLALRFTSNWQLAEGWNLRTELRPGLYTDFEDLSGDDFNVPFTIALGYDISPTLSVALAINADFRRDIPVVGGPGVIWSFAENWRLILLLPRPQIEFTPYRSLTLFAGGEFRALAIRVGEEFGNEVGDPRINDDQVTYREIRVGGGARWNITRSLRLFVEGGWAIDRRFQFDRSNLLLNGDGAPYMQVGLGGSY